MTNIYHAVSLGGREAALEVFSSQRHAAQTFLTHLKSHAFSLGRSVPSDGVLSSLPVFSRPSRSFGPSRPLRRPKSAASLRHPPQDGPRWPHGGPVGPPPDGPRDAQDGPRDVPPRSFAASIRRPKSRPASPRGRRPQTAHARPKTASRLPGGATRPPPSSDLGCI